MLLAVELFYEQDIIINSVHLFLLIFIFHAQWGSSVFLCYKKSVSASNFIAYKAGKSPSLPPVSDSVCPSLSFFPSIIIIFFINFSDLR